MKTIINLLLFIGIFSFSSCELFDKHEKPNIKFKTGTGYATADATVTKGSTVKVGIIADKTEDAMKTYNISYAYDGATSTTTKETFTLTSAEESHYEKDYEFTVRNVAGKEQWSFTITDRDGNIAQLSVALTVN
jgi:hypothetical protein